MNLFYFYFNRGFISLISEPLTGEFDDILKTQADKCIGVCPTGALGKLNESQVISNEILQINITLVSISWMVQATGARQ